MGGSNRRSLVITTPITPQTRGTSIEANNEQKHTAETPLTPSTGGTSGSGVPSASFRWLPLRRTVQLVTLAALVIIPVLNILEIYFIKGTFISMDIGDIAIADPAAILQAVISSKTINRFMLASLIIPVLLMLFLGRVWCSWFCPYYLFAEGVDALRRLLRLKPLKKAYSPTAKTRSNTSRLLFLLAGLLLTGIAGIPLLNLISAPGIISSQMMVLIKFHTVTFEIVFILVILAVEFFFVHRFWCRLFCPTGTCLSLLKTKRGLHVAKVRHDCSFCLQCQKTCPMGLDPMQDGNNTLCFNCASCIDVCPDNRKKNTLKYEIG